MGKSDIVKIRQGQCLFRMGISPYNVSVYMDETLASFSWNDAKCNGSTVSMGTY